MRSFQPMADSNWPLTPDQISRVEELAGGGADVVPPDYEGLTEPDAVLVQRYLTGSSEYACRIAVLRARGLRRLHELKGVVRSGSGKSNK